MDLVTQFLAILVGVVVSIVIPIIVKWAVVPENNRKGILEYTRIVLNPYVKAGIAAIIISLLILVFAPEDLDNWKAAAMLGLGWQSFIKNLLA
jgi:hypothetical protein